MRGLGSLLALAVVAAAAVAAGGGIYLLDGRLDRETVNAAVLLCAATPALLAVVGGVVGGLAWLDHRRWQRQQAEAERRRQRAEAQRLAEAEALAYRQQQRSEQTAEIRVARELVELLAAAARAQALHAQAQQAQLQAPAQAADLVRWEVPADWGNVDA